MAGRLHWVVRLPEAGVYVSTTRDLSHPGLPVCETAVFPLGTDGEPDWARPLRIDRHPPDLPAAEIRRRHEAAVAACRAGGR